MDCVAVVLAAIQRSSEQRIMAGRSAAQAALEGTILQTAKVIENELDAEIERLDGMDGEDLERLRCVNEANYGGLVTVNLLIESSVCSR